MNPSEIESYSNINGVTLECHPDQKITTVVMKNTNKYAVNVDFINGTVPSRIFLMVNESHKLQFSFAKCSPELVVIKKVTKA